MPKEKVNLHQSLKIPRKMEIRPKLLIKILRLQLNSYGTNMVLNIIPHINPTGPLKKQNKHQEELLHQHTKVLQT